MLEVRRGQAAFHPQGGQVILELGTGLFGVRRTARDGSKTVLAVHNVTYQKQQVRLDHSLLGGEFAGEVTELLSGRTIRVEEGAEVSLRAYEYIWLGF
jgi:sucrose phosphorylase